MYEFQEKKIRRRLLSSPLMVVALLVVLVVLARATWNVYEKAVGSGEKRALSAVEIARLEARQKTLEKEIAFLATAEGKEAEVRDRYRMAKEGEGLVVIVDERIPEIMQEKKGFVKTMWYKVQGYFGGDGE